MLAGFAYADNAAPVINSISGPSSAVTATEASSWLIYADDPEGQQVSFQINWGDGNNSAGTQNHFEHAFASAGIYTMTVTAMDPQGASSQNTSQVQVQPAPEPICPGYGILNYSDNVSAGDYQLVLEDVVYFDGRGAAYYDLFHGANKIAVIKNVTWNSTRFYTAANGDVLRIDSCMSYYGFTLDSHRSHVNLAIVNAPDAHANLPPVITGVSGPTSLPTNETGTWGISAFDPDGTYLSYGVQWGDGSGTMHPALDPTTTFQRAYAYAGNYTITFTVTDSEGASTQATLTATVIAPAGSCTSTFDVHFFYFPWCSHSAEQAPVNQALASEFPCSVWHSHNLDEDGEPELLLALESPLGVQGVQTPTTIIGQTILLGFDPGETPQQLRAALSSGGMAPDMPPAPPQNLSPPAAVPSFPPAPPSEAVSLPQAIAPPAEPAAPINSSGTASPQDDRLDRILALLEEIRDFLFGIFGK